MESHILKINLISAQGLKLISSTRQMRTYAVAWVDPDVKLRSQIDRIGAENPTWNDMFFFKVSSDILSSETSSLSVDIYAVGYIRDTLIGTARFIIGNIPLSTTMTTPSFTAAQIRRPSGRCQGLLNIGAILIDSSDIPALEGVSAIGYRDLTRSFSRSRGKFKKSQSVTGELSSLGGTDDELMENSSQGGDSPFSTTSSSSTTSTALKDLNAALDVGPPPSPKLARKNRTRSVSEGLLCGMLS